MIDASSLVYAVIGYPVSHSLSPFIHNLAFRYYSLNAVYVAFNVQDLFRVLDAVRVLGIAGLSVTMPYKKRILDGLDFIHPDAIKINAVNTVLNNNGCLQGYNTDGKGFCNVLNFKGYDLNGESVVIIGAGATSFSIAFNICSYFKPRSIIFLARSQKKINEFLQRFNRFCFVNTFAYTSYSDNEFLKYFYDSRFIINSTPLGMFPDIFNSPLPDDLISDTHVVFDIVYNPLETRFLRQARLRRATVINGLYMLVGQALEQFYLWTARKIDFYFVYSRLLEFLKKN